MAADDETEPTLNVKNRQADSDCPTRPRMLRYASSEYIKASAEPSRLLTGTQRILLVLDLNGTLILRGGSTSAYTNRPFVGDFLRMALSTFHVMIWSSAQPQNVQRMLEHMMTPEQRSALRLVWARDSFGLSKHDYSRKVLTVKDLSLVWANAELQERYGPFDQRNTLVVDDSVDKCRMQPFNHIHVTDFDAERKRAGTDRELVDLMAYLETVSLQSNVSNYVWHHPFHERQDGRQELEDLSDVLKGQLSLKM